MVKDQIRKIWSREIYMSRGIVQSLLKPEKLHLFVFNVETSSDGLHQSWLSYGLTLPLNIIGVYTNKS